MGKPNHYPQTTIIHKFDIMENEKNIENRLTKVEKAILLSALCSKQVLTFNEAVAFTGMSGSYLYKLTHQQKIPHSKPSGKLLYFNRLELEAWLLQNHVSTTDEISGRALNYCMTNKKGRKS